MNTGCGHNKDQKVRGVWTTTIHCRIMECQNYSEKCDMHALAWYGDDPKCNFVDPTTLRFDKVLKSLATEWIKLGAKPDDMLRCADHQELMFDPNKHFEPTWHYQHKGEPVSFFKDDVTEGTSATFEELLKYKVTDDNGIQQGEPLLLSQEDVKGMLCQLPTGWGLEEIR